MKSNEILKSQCIVVSRILGMANERFDLDLGGVNVNGILRCQWYLFFNLKHLRLQMGINP